MPLFQRSKTTIGLDIGSGFVKAAIVDHSGDAPRLLRLAALPLIPDAIVEGEIMDPPMVVETIQAVVDGLRTKSRSVVTAVGGRDVILRKISMERMSTADAREVITWEAEQYVPFDMENVQLDFQILDEGGDGPQMEVLLVAAKKELVEQRMSLLSAAGLSARIVDVDAFALFNGFEHSYPGASRGVAALVNVGHEVSTVIVHEDGAPIVTRDVPFGSKHLREDLRRLHGFSAEEAEAVVQGNSARINEVESLLIEKGTNLAMAIERVTAFVSVDRGPGSGIGAIHLSGGGARIPRLQETIASRLRVRIEVVNPFQGLDIASEALAEMPEEDVAAMWMLPVGLALRPAA